MTDKPSEDEKPDDAAFQRTLENMLRTPHKSHEPADKPHKKRPDSPKG